MKAFEIRCGVHHGIIKARGPGSAWRKLTKDKYLGFSILARYQVVQPQIGVWFYLNPQAFDELKPLRQGGNEDYQT